MKGADVLFTDVTKRFGPVTAVDGLNLELRPRSLTALLGPSGCGKSTSLALLAGLEHPDSGDIRVEGASMLTVAAERRPVALVFQRPLLFPHLSVTQNVAFGLRMRRTGRARTRQLVTEMLEKVRLPDLGDRRVGELSGGQEQRVALARALVLEPRVLLLDEPFSQLDPELRGEMRSLVRALHDESDVTTLFVTHDQAEAVEVADSIALLLDGRLASHHQPDTFYRSPPSLAAARFFGVTNELPGRIESGVFSLGPDLRRRTDLPDGDAVLVVRPESVNLTNHPGPDALCGVVTAARFAGTHVAVDTELESGRMLTVHVPVGTSITVGATVHLRVPADASTVFGAGDDQ